MAWVSDAVFSTLIVASFVLAASTLGFAVAWVRARERAIRAERLPTQALEGDSRFDRLENAVEAMAVEIERMAEGQRFVGKLLAERAQQERDIPPARPPRATTPH